MVQHFNFVPEINTEYKDPKVGKLVLLIESMQAVRYAHHYKLQGEELDTTLGFSNTLKDFANEDFTSVRFVRQPLKGDGGFYVEVGILVNDEWRTKGYMCKEHMLSFYPK